MSRESGYERYACDRAEKAHPDGRKPVEFLQPQSKDAQKWKDIEYTDEHGVTVKMTLCPLCAGKHDSIEETHQRDMVEFANEGLW